MQLMPRLSDLALFKAGNNMAARMAIMAITTSNSIKVKAGHGSKGRSIRARH
jgi:hypothetical protein